MKLPDLQVPEHLTLLSIRWRGFPIVLWISLVIKTGQEFHSKQSLWIVFNRLYQGKHFSYSEYSPEQNFEL